MMPATANATYVNGVDTFFGDNVHVAFGVDGSGNARAHVVWDGTNLVIDSRGDVAGSTGDVEIAGGDVAPAVDAAQDLGSASKQWKDLRLSGAAYPTSGVYLGGTVAANLLDDYEEGTWTAVWTDGTSDVSIGTASYTKIGNLVFCTIGDYNRDTSTLSGSMTLKGLPFSASASQGCPIYLRNGSTAGVANALNITASGTQGKIVISQGAAGTRQDETFGTATSVFTTFVYMAA